MGEMPKHWAKKRRQQFLSQFKKYIWDEPDLFKIGADQIIRRCIPESEVQEILAHAHSSACGGHFSGRKMGYRVLTCGFYWPTIFKDASEYARHCVNCQRMGGISKRDEMPWQPMLVVDIFDVWSIDFMDPFPNSCWYLYILVAVDYVSKWVDAIATRTNDHAVMVRVDRKDWSVKMDDALWAYRTAYKTPNGTTPYRLVYGKGCHLPMELAHQALWAIKSVNMDYNESGRLRKLKLGELEEIRDEAYECASAYKGKLKKVHDSKLRKRVFEKGQKVWLYNSQLKLFPEKLKSKRMGPFVITRVGKFGDVEIEDMHNQGRQTMNGHRLKPYLEGKDINMCEVDMVGYLLRSPEETTN
ncbi:uncharacterized protein LOC143541707 [Bidens hawaiensis]|uniref:uncharacterized protein LOC143541707 n=1 Tax=Bidens hawaiensis TaxID=980011 RepID=UPI00404B05A8